MIEKNKKTNNSDFIEDEIDDFCDLDPLKICDNCGKCLNFKDYATIKIEGIVGLDEYNQSHNSYDCKNDCCCDDDCDCDDDCCEDDCNCHSHEEN